MSFTQTGELTHVRLLELDPTTLTRPSSLSALPPSVRPVSNLKSEISDSRSTSGSLNSQLSTLSFSPTPLEFCTASSLSTLAAH